jgi:hypothetical protein
MSNPEFLGKRDVKIRPHLTQYAPVWILPGSEQYIKEDDSMLFNVIFQHNRYGWVTRRYLYDGFNDVLYHKGQLRMKEEDVLEIIEDHEPYLRTTVADIPNAYGG